MAKLLDALNAGIVCVAGNGVVTYANQAAAALTGCHIEPGLTELTDLVSQPTAATITRLVRSDGRVALAAMSLAAGQTPVRISAFELEATAGGGIACVLTSETGEGAAEAEGLVRGVKAAIDTVGPAFTNPELASTAAIAPPGTDDGEEYRRTIVQVTAASLSLWRRATGKSKIEFAEASGIWRASFDRSSLQARTLDKYLLIETLPANPRWRDVVQTGEFVLAETEAAASKDPAIAASRNELAERLTVLRDLLRLHMPAKRTAGPLAEGAKALASE
jgi:two-component system sensor histidine kinase ChiS